MKLIPAIERRNILQKKLNDKMIEIENLFNNESNFKGQYRTYIANSENDRDKDYKDAYLISADNKFENAAYNVPDLLNDLMKIFNNYLNSQISVEEANSNSNKVNIKINDIEYKFSGTTLLSIETAFKNLKKLLKQIPVLDTSYSWIKSNKKNVYEYQSETNRTVSVETFVVSAPATETHQAVTNKIMRQITVGVYKDIYYNGAITEADKDKLLDKIDDILIELKDKKNKANDIETIKYDIDFTKLII